MVIVNLLVFLNVFINKGIKSGIKFFVLFIRFLFLKFVFLDIWVFIILFVLFNNVGIKCKVIVIIIVSLWIGKLIFLNGFNNFFILLVNFIGEVVKVSNDVLIIKNINFIVIKIVCFRFCFVIVKNLNDYILLFGKKKIFIRNVNKIIYLRGLIFLIIYLIGILVNFIIVNKYNKIII